MAISQALMSVLTGRSTRRTAILSTAEQRIEALLRSTDPYDNGAVEAFAFEAADIASAAQDQVVSLATASQLRYLSEVGVDLDFAPDVPREVRNYSTNRPYRYAKPKKVKVLGKSQIRLPADEPFWRPAKHYRLKISVDGVTEEQALEYANERAKLVLDTNVSMAEREANSQILGEAKRKSKRVQGYRRVIHPELSDSGVCGLCLAASQQVYKVENLLDLHNGCKCETLPITADSDPGDELNREDLNNLYTLAGGTAYEQLIKLRFQRDEHGEIGPIIVPDKEAGPVETFYTEENRPPAPVDLDDVSKARDVAQRNLPTMESTLRTILAEGASESDSRVQYRRRMIAKYRDALSA